MPAASYTYSRQFVNLIELNLFWILNIGLGKRIYLPLIFLKCKSIFCSVQMEVRREANNFDDSDSVKANANFNASNAN